MIRSAFLAIAISSAMVSLASAAPITLECYLDADDGRQTWSISLNEEQGVVNFSHALASGAMKAIFAPDEVIWNEGKLRINRVTMEFSRRVAFSNDHGMCSLSQKQRAF